MALNNIQLNPVLLADLYRNSLIETTESPTRKEKITGTPVSAETKNNVPLKEWRYLGDHKKNILLIVRYDDTTYLPDEQLNFLTSVLSACKLSLGDVAVLNISNAPSFLYKGVLEKFKSSYVILFGITPKEFQMPVHFPEFQIQPFNNCTFLHSPVLETLKKDKVLKSKLWVCLKKTFNLS
ncbi:MAG TPA: hypothetical protein VGG71_00760 [Chitinophagaceae bacterium]